MTIPDAPLPVTRLMVTLKAKVDGIDWDRFDGKEAYESLVAIGVSGGTATHLDIVLIKGRSGFTPAVWSSSRQEIRATRPLSWGVERTFALDVSDRRVVLRVDGEAVIDTEAPMKANMLIEPGKLGVYFGAHRWRDGFRAAMRGQVREVEIRSEWSQ